MSVSAQRPPRRPYVTSGSGGPEHAGYVHVSQGEREQVVEHLSNAFADGRLDQLEFDRRMHLAMTSRTRSDLAPLLADLQPPHTPPPPAASASVTGSERAWGSLCHLLPLCSIFIGPLVVLLTVGRESAFVRDQAAESLNFQLTFLLANVGLVFAVVLTLGLAGLLYIPLGMAWFVFILIGSVGPLLGRRYRYPVNLRLVR